MTVNRAPACAVLLAAGFSSRMHALKPLLPFGDGTVLARTAGIWRRAGVERLVLVTGHRAEEIEAEAARLALPCVRNPRPEEGMFASLKLGLARCLELWGPDTGASAEETAREAGGQAAAGNDLWIGVLPA
ncbi:MAG: NTP transferase domain-containing protein, partial [Desulfovibrionaceae bacterium]|nr:NTP transferase domain-containing protein [Desulfovibrionaceae bacterium]